MWAVYDFANFGYTTVVLTTVFSAYFVSVVAAQKTWATLASTGALPLSYLVGMLTMRPLTRVASKHCLLLRDIELTRWTPHERRVLIDNLRAEIDLLW